LGFERDEKGRDIVFPERRKKRLHPEVLGKIAEEKREASSNFSSASCFHSRFHPHTFVRFLTES
jgi:hypothetical protein